MGRTLKTSGFNDWRLLELQLLIVLLRWLSVCTEVRTPWWENAVILARRINDERRQFILGRIIAAQASLDPGGRERELALAASATLAALNRNKKWENR